MKRIWAIVKAEFEGIHRYPNANEEVKYLSYPHRHIFKITVFIEQFHTERDIEYISFKKWLQSICPKESLNTMSCEQVAEYLLSKIRKRFPNRKTRVIVLENGENGAEIEGESIDYDRQE